MRNIIIAAVIFFIVLLFAWSRWKKKYGHSYRPAKGGVKSTGKGDFISQCYDIAEGVRNSPHVPKPGQPIAPTVPRPKTDPNIKSRSKSTKK